MLDGNVGEPWTGGSNIHPQPLPMHLYQRRPSKFASLSSFLTRLEQGTKEKLGSNDQKSDVTFQMWIREQAQAHEELGLDTVFKIPNTTWTDEVEMFKR